jgi:hypothetical protein
MRHNIAIELISGPVPYVTSDWQGIGYIIKVMNNGEEILTTDYRIGIGHVNIKGNRGFNLTRDEMQFLEVWRSKPFANFKNKQLQTKIACKLAKAQKVTPKADDVIYSLLSDSDAIDYPTFDDWADSMGYDKDSRKAESIYRACLYIGLKMRVALGDKGLADLREEFQDY